MVDLQGKTALVTGGGRGIGRAIAERLARDGALVAINYAANRAAAEDALKAIHESGGQGFLVQAKIGEAGAIEHLVSTAMAEFERRCGSQQLDILINNIGGGEHASIETETEVHFDWVMSNNVRGPFFLTQKMLSYLADNGRIVNISSAASRLAGTTFISYSMAKAAVEMFTRVLAKDLGKRGITVNSVAPGYTSGETNKDVEENPELARQIEQATLLGRFGDPSDIADIVHALVAPPGRWVTGQNIEASGGFNF